MDELIDALMENNLSLLHYWLREVPEVISETDSRGNPLLRHAVDLGSPEAVRLVLESGADPQYASDDGYTSLHSAIDRNSDHAEVMALLLSAGADVNARGINDWTPLHLAAARGRLDLIELLAEAGADFSIRTRIDDFATPAEEARILGAEDLYERIKALEDRYRR